MQAALNGHGDIDFVRKASLNTNNASLCVQTGVEGDVAPMTTPGPPLPTRDVSNTAASVDRVSTNLHTGILATLETLHL